MTILVMSLTSINIVILWTTTTVDSSDNKTFVDLQCTDEVKVVSNTDGGYQYRWQTVCVQMVDSKPGKQYRWKRWWTVKMVNSTKMVDSTGGRKYSRQKVQTVDCTDDRQFSQ